MPVKRKPIKIDRAKLRAAVRKLGNEYVFYTSDDAIELLPPAKLYKKKYLDVSVNWLCPDDGAVTSLSLLTDVKRFEKASLTGEYYEPLRVNSKNHTQKSAGNRCAHCNAQKLTELERVKGIESTQALS